MTATLVEECSGQRGAPEVAALSRNAISEVTASRMVHFAEQLR